MWFNHSKRLLAVVSLVTVALCEAQAQCPTAPGCVPGSSPAASASFAMGIYRVQLADLDTTTNGGVDGYRDYSCQRRANLRQGSTYTLRVQTGTSAAENAVAWVDFNNDGTFAPGERVLYSLNARAHAASFTVPVTATLNHPLRLRIAADYANAPIPTACSTPQHSQTEDYQVRLAAGNAAPVARFATADSVTCSGVATFRDASLNTPTGWRWQFGDGSTSTQQHPAHTYAAAGAYAVGLRVCNAGGCDSLTRVACVTVRTDGPRASACQPATAAYCCQFGLTRVRLAGLDHASTDGQAGYEDFSCAHRAALTADQPYSLQLTTGPNAHDVRVYLDLNDDGQFTGPNELLYQGASVLSPTVPLSIASAWSPAYHRALRLRIVADAAGSPAAGACGPVQAGQAEDYAVTLQPNTARPAAAFALRYQQLCGPVQVVLTNMTTGGATSYAWDFGDGTAAAQASPPAHTYATPGVYDVRLVALNAFGRDTARQQVAVAAACPAAYCPAVASGGTLDYPAYFTRFQFADLDNADFRGPGVGYFDYRTRYATVQAGQTYAAQGTSLPWQFSGGGPWNAVEIFIDYNQDGQFEDAERTGPVVQFSPHRLNVRIPGGAKAGATRMRVIVHQQNQYIYSGGCSPGFLRGSVEEYTVVILPPPVAPRVGFFADLTAACNGQVQFRDTSWSAPSAWLWLFGDGGSSTQQHPRHQYAVPGTYAVSLLASNAYGAQNLARPNYVTVGALAVGPRPAACLPSPTFGITIAQHGFDTLAIGSAFAYRQPWNAPGYRDETCTRPPIALTQEVATVIRFAGSNPVGTACFAWLDANDDGVFDPAAELIFDSRLARQFPRSAAGTFTLTQAVLTGRPLRLRVSAWGYDDRVPLTAVPSPCSRAVQIGQVRDFTAMVSANPLAVFPPWSPAPAPWRVAPNPTTGAVTVYGHFATPAWVEVRDVVGRVVLRARVTPDGHGNLDLSVRGLPTGIYVLRVADGKHLVRLALQ